ncbi:MAG: hypothetical protein LBQ59_03830 [Candidatus Peribacteria bacterium]|nr:hypothetical protein [Candidatus Peribacteria bacterium]
MEELKDYLIENTPILNSFSPDPRNKSEDDIQGKDRATNSSPSTLPRGKGLGDGGIKFFDLKENSDPKKCEIEYL